MKLVYLSDIDPQSVEVSDVSIRNNLGVSISIEGGSALLDNVAITENNGVPITAFQSSLVVRKATIANNVSNSHAALEWYGQFAGASLLVSGSSVVGNQGTQETVYVDEGRFVSINNVFSGNRSSTDGGALLFIDADVRIVNTLFAYNRATDSGGAIWSSFSSDVRISNSIFWKNAAPDGPDFGGHDDARVTISNSLVDHPLPSFVSSRGGLLAGDPLFVDSDGADDVPGTVDDDFHLTYFSPAVDTGVNDSLVVDFWDLDSDGNFDEWWP